MRIFLFYAFLTITMASSVFSQEEQPIEKAPDDLAKQVLEDCSKPDRDEEKCDRLLPAACRLICLNDYSEQCKKLCHEKG